MAVDELARIRRRKQARKWIAFSAAFVLSALLVWIFYFSNVLVVRQVEVQGELKHSSEAEVLAAAGIESGVPLARLNAQEISQSLTELTAIEAVEVRRVWPDRVILAVVEKSPVLVEKLGNRWQLISDEGERFGFVSLRPAGLMQVEVRSIAALSEAALLPALLPEKLQKQIVRIFALTPNDLRFELQDGKKVLWGNAADSSRKAQVLSALISVKADVYDVSAPDLPVTRRLKNN